MIALVLIGPLIALGGALRDDLRIMFGGCLVFGAGLLGDSLGW